MIKHLILLVTIALSIIGNAAYCSKCQNKGFTVEDRICDMCNGTGKYDSGICQKCGKDGWKKLRKSKDLNKGSGKVKVKIACSCQDKIIAIPKNSNAHKLLNKGMFGFKFGDVATNTQYTLSKPWRGKYNEVELRDLNSKKQIHLIRVIWNYGSNRPSESELKSEMSDLCHIFNVKYGFDIRPRYPATYYHSNDGDWYVGISYVDDYRMFFDIAYERTIPSFNLDGIDDL